MGKLHEVIAVEKDIRGTATKIIDYGLQYLKTEFTEGDVWITYKLNQNHK